MHESLAPLRQEGISTGAVVVMDTKSREVLALVGSHSFFDQDSEGQVDGTNAADRQVLHLSLSSMDWRLIAD